MSKDWVKDIHEMQSKYQTRDWVEKNPEKLREFLKFRIEFLQEELDETQAICDLINTQVDTAVTELAESAVNVDSSVDTALSAMTTASGKIGIAKRTKP